MGKLTMAFILAATFAVTPASSARGQVGEGQGKGPPAAVSPGAGQPWALWIGCWDRQAEDGVANGPALRVCVEPRGEQIVFRTSADGATVLEESLPTDGAPHPAEAPGCEGTQLASWAGARLLLTRSEISCPGRPRQVVSRIGTLRTLRLWLDVVVVEAGGRETVYLRKYVRVETGPPMLGPVTLATLSLDGLTYALSIVSPRAIEAVLVETRPTYALSGKRLLAMKNAGVPAHLIDLVIALSRPDKFRVASRGGGGAGGEGGGFGGFPIEISAGVPYAAEWGLPLWVYDEDYWYWGNCIYWNCLGTGIPIDPDYGPGDGGGQPGPPAEHGRVVNGLGYARVWPREAEGGGGGGEGHSSGRSGESAGGSGDPAGSGSNAGSGNVSPSGYSHGSGSDTGRTAEPRDSSPPPSPPPQG